MNIDNIALHAPPCLLLLSGCCILYINTAILFVCTMCVRLKEDVAYLYCFVLTDVNERASFVSDLLKRRRYIVFWRC